MKRPIDADTTPHAALYAAGRQEWLEQVGSLVTQRDNWRLTAFGCLAVTLASVCGLTYVATRPPTPPMIVRVDKLGTPPVVIQSNTAQLNDTEVIAGQLGGWISNVRTVTVDVAQQRRLIDRAYALVASDGAGYQFLKSWFVDHLPWERAKTETVGIDIDGIIPPASGNSWEIRWSEYRQGRDGTQFPKENWTVTVTVDIARTPATALDLKNPLGLWIRDINLWQRLDYVGSRS